MESPEKLMQKNIGFEVRISIEFFFNFWYTFAQMGEKSRPLSPIWMKTDKDPNTFEEFLEPEEYIDLGHLFITDRIFSSKDELVDWAKQTATKAKTYLIINRYRRSRTADRRPYVTLACECGAAVKKYTKLIVDDEEEEIPIKRRRPYGTKTCDCLFKLKRE
ncbi:hypothetical protein M9H77_16150 [Catharanthus roseus]|uniref:Uncharacterized protein n=1 Tax=Catharanthus roseus TaxID=4058 RepID=A0ACC0AZ28_CATRO|nr:hypothetical protein M9H77_16150 [Catharanthus roseus]